ncbi:response regulator [bacterium]|nr:response regulator [bacterium]
MDHRKKVIVVEDELSFAKVIKMRLESHGYSVEIVSDAYQGTQSIFKNQYDLIILDLMMPAGGGFSLLDRIRKNPNKSAIPVIVVTGKNLDETDRLTAENNEVKAVFQKPYNTEKFMNVVQALAPA